VLFKGVANMSINLEAILHPDEAFQEYVSSNLLSIYRHDYGYGSMELIESRIRNTTYLFDSNPIATYNYLSNINGFNIPSIVIEEYEDFLKVQQMAKFLAYESYYSLLCNFFGVKYGELKKLLKLDYKSFNFQSMRVLNDKKAKQEEKEKVLRRQDSYLEMCSDLGINPLTDSIYISILENCERQTQEEEFKYILKNSKWGKRILNKIREKFPGVLVENVMDILEGESTATTTTLFSGTGANHKLVYFPLIEREKTKALDIVILHELRHVIESGTSANGLYAHAGNKYKLINEIRTEKNALSDLDVLRGKPLWSQEEPPSNYYNIYQVLFPYTLDFFEEFRDTLNSLAIYNSISTFETIFGEKNLAIFEKYLEIVRDMLDTHGINYEDSRMKKNGQKILKKMINQADYFESR